MSDSISRAYRDGSIKDGLGDASTALAGCVVGGKVRLLVDIGDDGCDGHHPPHYLARQGEVLTVRSRGWSSLYISHEHITDNSFKVTLDEVVKI